MADEDDDERLIRPPRAAAPRTKCVRWWAGPSGTRTDKLCYRYNKKLGCQINFSAQRPPTAPECLKQALSRMTNAAADDTLKGLVNEKYRLTCGLCLLCPLQCTDCDAVASTWQRGHHMAQGVVCWGGNWVHCSLCTFTLV